MTVPQEAMRKQIVDVNVPKTSFSTERIWMPMPLIRKEATSAR